MVSRAFRNCFAFSIGTAIIGCAFQTHADSTDAASCAAMKITDQCRISWSFSRPSISYYFVQQFDQLAAEWRTLANVPAGTLSQGTLDKPVEAGYLYRVLACDDAKAKAKCSGSTMVWAPFIQPEDQVHLIPSQVPLTGSEAHFGKPAYGLISKKGGWLSQVIAYNVIQMENAIAHAKTTDLPDMTPVKDIRFDPPDDPIEQVQFNVYWFYSAERGAPINQPEPAQFQRPPHEHPERHPQETQQQ